LADDSYQQIARVKAPEYPCDLHEFLLTPTGTALYTAYEPGVVDHQGRGLIVGHAQEVDVASNDLLFDWACYPAVSADQSYEPVDGQDYFHINSIDLWPVTSQHSRRPSPFEAAHRCPRARRVDGFAGPAQELMVKNPRITTDRRYVDLRAPRGTHLW
jgi:hypothetical protein